MKMRRNIVQALRPLGLALLLAGAVSIGARDAMAQSAQLRQPTTAFFIGTIVDYANGRLTVDTQDGQTLQAIVNPRSKIALLKPAAFADLQEGTYIASVGKDQDNDTVEAIELRIVEEKLRGVGEGTRPFHGGEDKTSTTNAKIVSVSTTASPPEIAIRLRGRDMKIILPNTAPITFMTVGDASALKPGMPVSVFTVRSRTGSTDVVRINIGLDGVVPQL